MELELAPLQFPSRHPPSANLSFFNDTMAESTTRAYSSFTPSWQRFHEFAAPIASSSGAGSAAASSSSNQHHPYTRQYSHVYSARLAGLRERCLKNAREKLAGGELDGKVEVVDRIIEVKEGAWSILVGTIVKETDPKRRPPVTSTYTDADACSFLFPTDGSANAGVDGVQESLRAHLFDLDKGDILHLEDESGRVELSPETTDKDGMDVDNADALDPNKVATGVVVAVIGKVSAEKGVMHVHSVHFAGPPPAEKKSASGDELRGARVNDNETADPTLLLVSGLGCGSDSPSDVGSGGSLALRREMLLEYLTNNMGNSEGNGSSVCRVIVAGGSIAPPVNASSDDETTKENKKSNCNSVAKSKNGKNDSSSALAFSLRELDLYLSEILSSGVPVDYIPGWHDPTNANWPQRPIHSCLLPNACSYVDLFSRSTNPYEGVVGGNVRVLGSDGLNVADLRRYLVEGESNDGEEKVVAASSIDTLQTTFQCGHIAPTGPDSLPTFPSSESDPFVLQTRPNVFFAGNCEKFETRLVGADGNEVEGGAIDVDGENGTRLICVPSFALTGEAVLINLKTLKCDVVSFNDVGL